jgi:hypothetical protein
MEQLLALDLIVQQVQAKALAQWVDILAVVLESGQAAT